VASRGTATLTDCTISGNSASESGGGLHTNGTTTLTNVTVSGNSSGYGGGLENPGTITLTNCTISSNSSVGYGGGMANGGMATLTDVIFNGNSAEGGGGITSSGTTTLTDCTVNGNTVAQSGGGLNGDGTFTLTGCTISGNSAAYGGGMDANGTAMLTNCTISGNSANHGGGLHADGTTMLTNCTVSGNSGSNGGGIYFKSAGTLNNTIVAGNTDSSGANDLGGAGTASGSNNLIGIGGSGGLSNGVDGNIVLTSLSGIGLAPLNYYGGPTETIALQPGSPAIGNGESITGLTTDQRGFPVATPTPDIGAFQTNPLLVVNTTSDGTGLPTGILSLREAVNMANTLAAGATISFDPTVFGTPQTITLTNGPLVLSNTLAPESIVGPGASNLTISGNSTFGVFQVSTGVTASLTRATIADGSASSGGGIDNSGSLTLSNDVFTNDVATYYGGAVYNNGGTLSVSNSTFSNNAATYGLGAAIDNSGTLTVTASTFSGGVAFQGGAIDNKSGTLTVSDSSFVQNSAIEGGGIFNDATATVTGSTIANNTALPALATGAIPSYTSFDGGAIANDLAGELTLINSTLSSNFAGQNGGAIDSVGTLTATNDTIAYNAVAAGGSGGGVDASAGTAIFNNTIIAQNLDGLGTTATPNDIAGTVSVLSAYNLIGTGSGGLTNGTNGNLVGVTSPHLGLLADNGGPTETIALLKGSPAIDAGSNALAVDPQGNPLTTDQRGTSFPFTGTLTSGSASVWAVSSTTGLVAGQTVTGPTTIFTGTLTSGSASVPDISSTTGLVVGQIITGTNIPSGTKILTVNSSTNTITLSAKATASGSQSLIATDLPPGTTIQTIDSSTDTITLSAKATVGGSQGLTASSYPRIVNGVVDIGAFEAGTASVYTVDLKSDTGAKTSQNAGDLLYCITQADADQNPSGSLIVFDPAVFATSTTINLSSGPLLLTNTSTPLLAIDGPGANILTINLLHGGTTSVFQVAQGVTASLSGLTISGGNAETVGGVNGDGGAIDNSGTLTLTNMALTSNDAIDGAGIANEPGGKLTVSDSTLSGNTGTTGGAVYNAGTLTATNTTIAANTAFLGAGVFNVGTLTLVNSTIADNTVPTGGIGGGFDAVSGSAALYNTIVALNTSANGNLLTPNDIGGTVLAASSHNLIGTGGSGGLTSGTNGNLVGVANPGLGSLANNGGPTQTIALLAGSPAIGAGSSTITGVTVPTTDQRGDPRPSSSIDIGAYQTQVVATPLVAPESTPTPAAIPVSIPLVTSSSATVAAPPVTNSVPSPVASPKAVKKVVGSKTALPNGGPAAKFHRQAAIATKHASARAKK